MTSGLCTRILLLVLLTVFWKPTFADDVNVEGILDKVEANLKSNPNLARSLADTAEEEIAKRNLDEYRPRLFNLQAHLNILSSDLHEAFAKALEAEKYAKQQNNKLQLAEAIRRQGIINNFLGFPADAIELLTESLKLHQELDSKYLLHNLQSIGNVYITNDAWAQSLLEIGETLVDTAVIKQNSYFEEQGYSFIVDYHISRQQYLQASRLTEQVQRQFGEESREIFYHGARAELGLGNFQKALNKIDMYLELVSKHNFIPAQIAAKQVKSDILKSANRHEEARDLLLTAVNLLEDTNYDNYKEQVAFKLATYYQEQGNFEQALNYFRQYAALKEKVFNDKQQKQLAFSRARLELEQKNQKITELQLSQQISDQQNRYQLIVIVLTGSIAITLLFLYWRMAKQKQLLQAWSTKLKHATEAKSQFLARMSHEIRTPINAIIGLTKLSRKQQLTEKQLDVNLQQVEDSSQTLLGVINDILDFSKIEAGKMDIEHVSFELDKVIDQATRLQTLKAQEKGLEIIQYIARDVPLNVIGDALRLQQVLNNLISNAVKFTKNGVISITANRKYSDEGLLLEFSVKDTGIGMTGEQVAKLFDSFSQADESTTRKFGGTGLGLAICKQLVELMGGKIWVESHPGQGATFYFTVLIEEDSLPQKAMVMSEAKLSELRVLVVDDIDLCRQAAAEALIRVNVNPDLVDSGFKAIEKIRLSIQDRAPYDLILLDWQMPELDGIEVASMINQEITRDKPEIVMLSAYDMKSLKELGEPVGIKSYLEKPIHNSNLINLIVEIMNKDQPDSVSTALSSHKKAKENDVIPKLKGRKILLVEDNKLNQKVAIGFLSDTFADISVAENGQLALDMLQDQKDGFDVIFMDVQMPVMDGLTASQKIRKELHLSTPIIAMTANAMQGDIDKCIAVGMDAHVSKPVDPDNLYEVLSQFVDTSTEPEKHAIPVEVPSPQPNKGTRADISAQALNILIRVNKPLAISKLKYNEKLYEGLVQDFIAMQPQLSELFMAVKASDLATVNRIVHTYKSSLSYVGAYELEKFTVDVESRLHNCGEELTEELITEVTELCQMIEQLTFRLKGQYQFHKVKDVSASS